MLVDAHLVSKASHDADMVFFSYKESIKLFINSGPLVFVCFLDATKVYDKVNHTKLKSN